MTNDQTIALDTSAIFAILAFEPEAALFTALITRRQTLVGAPSLVEARLVMERLSNEPEHDLRTFLDRAEAKIVSFDKIMFEAAAEAFHHFGKGRGHPAKLNFGDCLAYAVAKVHAVPLLFKGNDFIHTDLVPVYNPRA
ncbi:Ribonuclease VapC42 [Methylobacterium brachiatum]|nr:Ribonuclease VapC42 [Methylobacterium brachiatum]